MSDSDPNTSNRPTPAELSKLFDARVDQLANSTQRARIPFGILILVSFTIGAQLYLVKLGWNERQLRDVDEDRMVAERNCPCKSPRIKRYHYGLYSQHSVHVTFDIEDARDHSNPGSEDERHLETAEECLEIWRTDSLSRLAADQVKWNPNAGCPCDTVAVASKARKLFEQHEQGFDWLTLRSSCKEQPLGENCLHLKESARCLAALDAEYQELVKRRIAQQTWSIPVLEINASFSDVGILGSFAVLLLLGYFYAASRREKFALDEFVQTELARPKTGISTDKRRFRLGKSDSYWARFSDPLFAPKDYYLAFESVAHRFVFLSSAPDYLLRGFTLLMIGLPAIVQSLVLGLDVADHQNWYSASGDIWARIIVSLLLVMAIWIATWKTLRFQNSIYHSLIAWAEMTKGRLADLIFGKIPDLEESDGWLKPEGGQYGWVLLKLGRLTSPKPTLITQGDELDVYEVPQ